MADGRLDPVFPISIRMVFLTTRCDDSRRMNATAYAIRNREIYNFCMMCEQNQELLVHFDGSINFFDKLNGSKLKIFSNHPREKIVNVAAYSDPPIVHFLDDKVVAKLTHFLDIIVEKENAKINYLQIDTLNLALRSQTINLMIQNKSFELLLSYNWRTSSKATKLRYINLKLLITL